jgi:hypothetical protein
MPYGTNIVLIITNWIFIKDSGIYQNADNVSIVLAKKVLCLFIGPPQRFITLDKTESLLTVFHYYSSEDTICVAVQSKYLTGARRAPQLNSFRQ